MDVPARRRCLPADYPAKFVSVVRLDDGREVDISPILPEDAPELAEAIRTADPQTLHARFLGAPPRLTEAVLRELTEVDYTNRFALVARSQGKGVGIARYVALPHANGGASVAEVAVAVDPDWRQVGLATHLVELLAERALECGITEFTALFLPTNRPVVELARDGHARVVIKEGAGYLNAPLETADGVPTEIAGSTDRRPSSAGGGVAR